LAGLAGSCATIGALSARAEDGLDAGGLTFRDFAKADNGASFNRDDSMKPAGPEPGPAHILGIDSDSGFARIQFDSIKIEVCLPLGWHASEDSERAVGYSADRSYRVIVWRVDFAYEGVQDAEQYASSKRGAIQARRPGVQARVRKLPDGTFLVIYENVPPSQGDSGKRTVFDLVFSKPGEPKQGVLVTLGVPAADMDRGLKLLALLKLKLIIQW
jgi:hypothetical protein